MDWGDGILLGAYAALRECVAQYVKHRQGQREEVRAEDEADRKRRDELRGDVDRAEERSERLQAEVRRARESERKAWEAERAARTWAREMELTVAREYASGGVVAGRVRDLEDALENVTAERDLLLERLPEREGDE